MKIQSHCSLFLFQLLQYYTPFLTLALSDLNPALPSPGPSGFSVIPSVSCEPFLNMPVHPLPLSQHGYSDHLGGGLQPLWLSCLLLSNLPRASDPVLRHFQILPYTFFCSLKTTRKSSLPGHSCPSLVPPTPRSLPASLPCLRFP